VDEYVASADGGYNLAAPSVDLLQYLGRQGLAVSLVPDVANAQAYNSVRAAGGPLLQAAAGRPPPPSPPPHCKARAPGGTP
jgi:hypothetical protein